MMLQIPTSSKYNIQPKIKSIIDLHDPHHHHLPL